MQNSFYDKLFSEEVFRGIPVKGVQTFVAMVIFGAMHCSTSAHPFGVKVEFRSISVIHHATFSGM